VKPPLPGLTMVPKPSEDFAGYWRGMLGNGAILLSTQSILAFMQGNARRIQKIKFGFLEFMIATCEWLAIAFPLRLW
jgi:hypothetical protein